MVATEKDTSGGSMLTEVNDDAAMPTSCPSTDAATATTPLGKAPKASRRVRWSSGVVVGGAWTVMRTAPVRVRGQAGQVGRSGCAVASQASYAAGWSCWASRT